MSLLKRAHALTATMLSGCAALAACVSLNGLSGGGSDAAADAGHPRDGSGGHDATVDARSSTDARVDTGARRDSGAPDATDGAVEAAPVCGHAAPVPPPSAVSPGSKDVSLVMAVEMFTSGFAITDAGASGFDLDNTCTCPGPPSCNSPVGAPNCDLEPGGHDIIGNSLATLFEADLAGTSGGDINHRLARGKFTIIVTIQDYNGGLNDSGVLVAVYASSGLDSDGGVPAWDGTDLWNIDPATSIGNPAKVDGGYSYTPRYLDPNAYVTDGVLVAHFPEVVVGLAVGTLSMTGTILEVNLSKSDAGAYSATGEIAGRVAVSSLFALIGHLGYEGDGGEHKLCGTDPLFMLAQHDVCSAADIMSTSSQDNTDAGCNALSFAIGFDSSEARLGPSVPPVYALAGCDGSVADCLTP